MISLIIALDENNGFSMNGALPWDCPEDLARFKALTDSKSVIMGRKTWESVPQNIFTQNKMCTVVSNNEFYRVDAQFKERVKLVQDTDRLNDGVLIGGKSLITAMQHRISEINLTIVKGVYECDMWFGEMELILSNFCLDSEVETGVAVYRLYKRI